ncbi:MAG: flagellar biosynthesis protein FlgD [Gammaproteobacteria bacterium]|nr:MAG: flagellar biosynthesis protein FlgD [Gammaproteobacteria bacterium]
MINTDNAVLQNLGITNADDLNTKKQGELSQEDFFALLTVQLAQQDPFKPLDNTEFVAQMAQFSSLESLQSMQTSFSDLASAMTSNQALQASALVGRTVLVPSNVASFNGTSEVQGMVALSENTQNVVLRIEDEAGQLIKTIELGDLEQGPNDFTWDGTNEAGSAVAPGFYSISVTGSVFGRETRLPTGVYARVDSVNLGGAQGGVYLNLDGLGSVSLDDVSQIKN